jgi:hypothetical protein
MPVPQSDPWFRFQPPPLQTQRADFPHWAFLSALPQGIWDLSGWERFRPWLVVSHLVAIKQPQGVIQPSLTPPLPAEARPFACPHQVPPYSLFDPLPDVGKAASRVAN